VKDAASSADHIEQIDKKYQAAIKELDAQLDMLADINTNRSGLNRSQSVFLKQIKDKTFTIDNLQMPYLAPAEFESLNVVHGTLTPKEKQIVNNHADVSEKILRQLPWPKKFSNIPSIAGRHHEKLDGTGYPFQLDKSQLSLQARILAICDIFEALSAPDRPYKAPQKLSRIKKILEKMGQSGHLDNDIITLLFSSQTHKAYAQKFISKSQIDI
jgi:hypothetical protein